MLAESISNPASSAIAPGALKLVSELEGPLDKKSFGKTIRVHIREFGCTFGIIFLLIAGYQGLTGGSLATSGALVFSGLTIVLLCYQVPLLMLPVWRSWMAFATFLGHIMTTVLLSIVWTIVLIPMAFLLRMIGKRVMDLTFDPSVESYWEDRAEKLHDFKLLERQF